MLDVFYDIASVRSGFLVMRSFPQIQGNGAGRESHMNHPYKSPIEVTWFIFATKKKLQKMELEMLFLEFWEYYLEVSKFAFFGRGYIISTPPPSFSTEPPLSAPFGAEVSRQEVWHPPRLRPYRPWAACEICTSTKGVQHDICWWLKSCTSWGW